MDEIYFKSVAADKYGAIQIERRWQEYVAYLAEDLTKFGTGRNSAVALADLYIHHSTAVVEAYKRAMASYEKFEEVLVAISETFPNK